MFREYESYFEVSESLCEPPWGILEPLLATLSCLSASVSHTEVSESLCEPPSGVWEPLWATLKCLRAFVNHPQLSESQPEVSESLSEAPQFVMAYNYSENCSFLFFILFY